MTFRRNQRHVKGHVERFRTREHAIGAEVQNGNHVFFFFFEVLLFEAKHEGPAPNDSG